MNLGQGLPIHFPCEKDLMNANFAPRHRHHIIEDFALFKVRVGSCKLNVLGTVLEAATVLDDLFEADASPTCGTNGTFTPLRRACYRR